MFGCLNTLPMKYVMNYPNDVVIIFNMEFYFTRRCAHTVCCPGHYKYVHIMRWSSSKIFFGETESIYFDYSQHNAAGISITKVIKN